MSEHHDSVKIALVTGYLGAGKTTLLNHILSNDRNLRAAVIVNDIGEINIDEELIRDGGLSISDTVIPLTNGCICCTLSEDLADQLAGIADSGDFDYIVIEASGICEPMPIAYTISEFCGQIVDDYAEGPFDEEEDALGIENVDGGEGFLALDNIITVVDCARMIDEFDSGKRLLADDIDEDDVESLLIEQLEFCTTVVLNKTDLVTREQLDELRAIVRSLQKDAVIIEAVNGVVPLEELLDTGRFDFDAAYQSAAWLDMMMHPEEHEEGEALEYGISTFVYQRRQPFNLDAFSSFTGDWPQNVIRTKGMVWIDEQPDTCFLLEQAGNQRFFVDNGPFVAALPEPEQEQVLEENPGIMTRWDEKCGDRLTMLVFIGRDMDRAAIEARLDACLAE